MGRMLLFGFAALFALLFTPLSPEARTWYLKADGTGDAPHLEAAMDSAAYGDTILVGPGEYEVNCQGMREGVYLISEMGPALTRFVPTPAEQPLCALLCQNIFEAWISGFWFDGYRYGGSVSTGAVAVHCYYAVVSYNIFTNCSPVAVTTSPGSYLELTNNTFVNNGLSVLNWGGTGEAFLNVFWEPAPGLPSSLTVCNDFLREEDIPSVLSYGNFSADPLFCEGDYSISANSPCAPGNSPSHQCPLIGAVPVSCTPTPTEERTWGSIKSLFEKP